MNRSAFKCGAAALTLMLILSSVSYAEDKSAPPKTETRTGNLARLLEAPFQAAGAIAVSAFDVGHTLLGGKRLNSPFGDFVANSVSSSNILTRQDMDLSAAENLPEAMQQLPGVVLSDFAGNGEEPTLDFRGYNEGQDFVFLLDGVRLNEPKSNNMNFALIPLGILERVEVSRGGSSFLYGEGAMGGVVNGVTRFPEREGVNTEVKTRAGSFGEWGESFETSGKKDNLGVYVSGDVYHRRGFRQNTSVEKEDFYSKLLWDPTDKSQVSLSYLYADANLDRSGSIRESLLHSLGPEATERPRNFADLQTHLGILDYRLLFADSVVLTGNVFARQVSELTVANFATFETNDNEQDLSTDSWGTTIQLDHAKDWLWNLSEGILIGVDYHDYRMDQESFDRSKVTLQRLGTTVDSVSDKEAFGIFSKVSLSWFEKIGGYYGIRYDNIDFKNQDPFNPNSNLPAEISKTSHSLGASGQLTSRLALSGSYSKSFRSPTLSDLYTDPAFGGNPALEAEEAENYELGLKWTEKSALLSSALFYSEVQNEIGFDANALNPSAFGGLGQNRNIGVTERYGLETFAEAWMCRALRLRGSHTYTEALFKSNDSFNQKSGDHIPMVPRNRFASSLLLRPFDGLDIQGSMVAVAKQVLTNDFTNDANGRRLPAYTVFDLNAVYRYKDWRFSFAVKNLFDERYEMGGSLGGGSVTDNFYVPAPGRSYHASASYRF